MLDLHRQARAACNRTLRDQFGRMSPEQVAVLFGPPEPVSLDDDPDENIWCGMSPFMLALRAEVETAAATCQTVGQLPNSTVQGIVTASHRGFTALHVAAMCPAGSFAAFRDLVLESEISDELFRELVLARTTAMLSVKAQNYHDDALMGDFQLTTRIAQDGRLEQSALQLAAQSDPRTFELMLDLLVDRRSQGGLIGRLAGPTLAASRLSNDELRALLLGIENPASAGGGGGGREDWGPASLHQKYPDAGGGGWADPGWANKPVLQLLLERGDASALVAWKLLVDQLELATDAEFSDVLKGPSAGDMLRSALIGGDRECARLCEDLESPSQGKRTILMFISLGRPPETRLSLTCPR